jgi:tetratricopeptide (TPR) repeat protein
MARIGRRMRLAMGLAALSLFALVAARLARRVEGPDERIARRALFEGRYDEADEALRRWLGASPGSAGARLLEARIDLAMNRPSEAAERLKLAQSCGAGREDLLLLRALIAAKVGRPLEAEPELGRAFAEARTPDRQVDEALARIYLETYDLPRAATVLDRWAVDFPGDPKPHLWLAEVHGRDANRASLVQDDYREALRRDPSLAPARLGLAGELRKAHRNAEAAIEYEAYLALRPDDAVAHLGAGQNQAELGDDPAARGHFGRAIELNGKDAAAHTEMGQLCSRLGESAEALDHFDRAVGLDPFDVTARHQRGLLLARLGRADEARVEFDRAAQLRADPNRPNTARSNLLTSPHDRASQLEIARWMFEHGRPEEGVRWANRIIAERPGDPDVSRMLADYHDRRGEQGLANWYRLNVPAGAAGVGPTGEPAAKP